MPAPNEFTRKLTDAVGKEAADQMVDWMHEREVDTTELRADLAEVRQEMHAGFARVDAKFDIMDARLASLDKTMEVRFATVDARLAGQEARFEAFQRTIEAKIAEATSTQLKWSVAMWIATMAFLTAVIRLPR